MQRPRTFQEFMASQATPAGSGLKLSGPASVLPTLPQDPPQPSWPTVGNHPGLNLPVNPEDKYSNNIAIWNDIGSMGAYDGGQGDEGGQATPCPSGQVQGWDGNCYPDCPAGQTYYLPEQRCVTRPDYA